MKLFSIGSTSRIRKIGFSAIVLVCAVITVLAGSLLRPAAARAAGKAPTIFVAQSGGPVGIVRGQSALIGLLLPAVQRALGDGSVRVGLHFNAFPSGKLVTGKSFDLRVGGQGASLIIHVNQRGRIFINGQETDGVLPEGERLNLVAVAELESAGDVPPGPCATLQVFNAENGHTLVALGLNFLPAVQRTE